MKLNIFFKQLVLIIIVSITIFACATSKKNNTADNQKNIKTLNHFTDIDTTSSTAYNQTTQLKIQEPQIDNIIYFSLNEYDIPSQFFDILNAYANILYNNSLYHIRIEGHADERGTPEYNIALGERRANSVKLYLQSKGVLSEQISTVSYGKEKPAVPGHNEEAYSKNRRVVLTYR